MARSTLKLPKPRDPAAAPGKPKTTRARDAQRRLHAGLANIPLAGTEEPPRPPRSDRERGSAPPRPAGKGAPPRGAGHAKGKPPGARGGKPPLARVGKPPGPREGKPPGAREGKPPGAREGKPPGAREGKPPGTRDGKPPGTRDGKPPGAWKGRPGEQRPGGKPPAARGEGAPRPAPKPRPPVDEEAEPRLSKLMGERGLCSRREADEWIENGWVKVNGQVVSTLGSRVPRDARIEIDAAAARHQGEQVTILLNKPVGYVSGQPEDDHEPAMVLIKPENRWAEDPSQIEFKRGHLRGLAPAGRLDIDSTGLLVFTQDGRVAKRLVGGDSDVEKEYLVRVEGTLTEEGLGKLRHGLELDGVKLKPARVSWANEDQLRFVLREGRKRQIRRMCELVGLRVTALKRVRTGGVPLGKLPPGQWRYLRRDERF